MFAVGMLRAFRDKEDWYLVEHASIMSNVKVGDADHISVEVISSVVGENAMARIRMKMSESPIPMSPMVEKIIKQDRVEPWMNYDDSQGGRFGFFDIQVELVKPPLELRVKEEVYVHLINTAKIKVRMGAPRSQNDLTGKEAEINFGSGTDGLHRLQNVDKGDELSADDIRKITNATERWAGVEYGSRVLVHRISTEPLTNLLYRLSAKCRELSNIKTEYNIKAASTSKITHINNSCDPKFLAWGMTISNISRRLLDVYGKPVPILIDKIKRAVAGCANGKIEVEDGTYERIKSGSKRPLRPRNFGMAPSDIERYTYMVKFKAPIEMGVSMIMRNNIYNRVKVEDPVGGKEGGEFMITNALDEGGVRVFERAEKGDIDVAMFGIRGLVMKKEIDNAVLTSIKVILETFYKMEVLLVVMSNNHVWTASRTLKEETFIMVMMSGWGTKGGREIGRSFFASMEKGDEQVGRLNVGSLSLQTFMSLRSIADRQQPLSESPVIIMDIEISKKGSDMGDILREMSMDDVDRTVCMVKLEGDRKPGPDRWCILTKGGVNVTTRRPLSNGMGFIRQRILETPNRREPWQGTCIDMVWDGGDLRITPYSEVLDKECDETQMQDKSIRTTSAPLGSVEQQSSSNSVPQTAPSSSTTTTTLNNKNMGHQTTNGSGHKGTTVPSLSLSAGSVSDSGSNSDSQREGGEQTNGGWTRVGKKKGNKVNNLGVALLSRAAGEKNTFKPIMVHQNTGNGDNKAAKAIEVEPKMAIRLPAIKDNPGSAFSHLSSKTKDGPDQQKYNSPYELKRLVELDFFMEGEDLDDGKDYIPAKKTNSVGGRSHTPTPSRRVGLLELGRLSEK